MEIRKVSDLKSYLISKSISPERFGKETMVSNMTIRRMIRKDGATLIPEKYHLQFDQHVRSAVAASEDSLTTLAANLMKSADPNAEPGGFNSLLDELEQSGKKINDLGKLESDVKTKLFDFRIDKILRTHVGSLVVAIRSKKFSTQQKAVCVGALLYLVNPLDLIPDAIPVIGYLDDFAVLSLAVAFLARTAPPAPAASNTSNASS